MRENGRVYSDRYAKNVNKLTIRHYAIPLYDKGDRLHLSHSLIEHIERVAILTAQAKYLTAPSPDYVVLYDMDYIAV